MKRFAKLYLVSYLFKRKALKLPLDSSPRTGFSPPVPGEEKVKYKRDDDAVPETELPEPAYLHQPQKEFGYIVEGLEQLREDLDTFNANGDARFISELYQRSMRSLGEAINKAAVRVRKHNLTEEDFQELRYVDNVFCYVYKVLQGAGWNVASLPGFDDILRSLYIFGPTFHSYIEIRSGVAAVKNPWNEFIVSKD